LGAEALQRGEAVQLGAIVLKMGEEVLKLGTSGVQVGEGVVELEA
jgi:hypothetical protein